MFYTILVTDHVPSDPKIPKPIATVETLAKSVFSSKSPLGLLKALDFISQLFNGLKFNICVFMRSTGTTYNCH